MNTSVMHLRSVDQECGKTIKSVPMHVMCLRIGNSNNNPLNSQYDNSFLTVNLMFCFMSTAGQFLAKVIYKSC